ncbi:MAG: DUF4836 family protein [Ferruginibacter sp.]
MLHRKLSYFLFAAALFTLASCSNSNDQGKLIPKDAALVVHVDGKSLSAKLPWDSIKQNPLVQQASGDTTLPPIVKQLLDNPENSGIDTKADLLFFAQKDSLGGYIAFEGTVKDATKFIAFNKQLNANAKEIQKDGITLLNIDKVTVGWKSEKFVYVVDAPQLGQMDELSRRMMNNDIDVSSTKTRNLESTVASIFALKGETSLEEDKKFTTLMKESGDVHFWMNTEALNKGSVGSSALAMLNLDKLYKGNFTTATVNFENGKVLMNAKTYAGEELTKLYKKYSGGKVNEDMLKRIPGKDAVALFALNFKPEGIQELIKLTNLDGLLNIGLATLGFSIEDFVKANKGDIVFGLTDFSIPAPDTLSDGTFGMAARQQPEFNMTFGAAIGDKEAFNKLINAGKKAGEKFITGEGVSTDSVPLPFGYSSNGTYFAMSNKKANADAFTQSAGTAVNEALLKKLTGSSFSGYVNIHAIMKAFENEAKTDSVATAVYNASLATWEDVFMSGGEFTDGAITQKIEINLTEKNTNSLLQLNRYATKLSALYKANQDQMKKNQAEFDEANAKLDNNVTVEPAPSK